MHIYTKEILILALCTVLRQLNSQYLLVYLYIYYRKKGQKMKNYLKQVYRHESIIKNHLNVEVRLDLQLTNF